MAQPSPATPPYEPPQMPLSGEDSGRRILWIIALYRAICAAVLLGVALLIDLRSIQINLPNAFVTGAGLYFLFSLAAFWWVQSDRSMPTLSQVSLGLLAGDIFFLAMIIIGGGNAVAPLPRFRPCCRTPWPAR